MAVLVLLIALFGILGLHRLPLQLLPDISRPEISIQVQWRAASPQEVEAEILEPLESALQGVSAVEELAGEARMGGALVQLRFAVGTDMSQSLVEVIGGLNGLRPLPKDAERPVVEIGGHDSTSETLASFFVQKLPSTPGTIESHRSFIEDNVRARLESIPGVGSVSINANPADDVLISLDPVRAAALQIDLPQAIAAVNTGTDVSGGQLDVGRRQYVLRFTGSFKPEQLGARVLAWREGRPVRLEDVARISISPPPRQSFAYQNGNPAVGIQIFRAHGANVLETLARINAAVSELRDGPLRARGLTVEQSFDAALFIHRAIHLLCENLAVGTLLALVIVWGFVRASHITLVIALTIPLCLCGTFIFLALLGGTLNVISLAGLALAVGMVVEGAIVVCGNYVRLLRSGMSQAQAARDSSRQVAGALISSTVTTIAVFLPVLFLKDVEGQLFKDLAVTISVALGVSVLVALAIVPTALTLVSSKSVHSAVYSEGWSALTEWVLRATKSRTQQVTWVVALLLLPLVFAWALWPPLDYLPPVKRAAVDAFFNFPPGMSPEQVDRELLPVLLERMRPYMDGHRVPRLKNWYVETWPGGGNLAARVEDEDRIGELERIVRDQIVTGLPDTQVFAFEGDLFGGIGGSARSVQLHLQTEDTALLFRIAQETQARLEKVFPNAAVQIVPNLEDVGLELRATPDDRRIAEAGWDRAKVGDVIRVLGEGAWLGDYFDGRSRRRVVLRSSQKGLAASGLEETPLWTPSGVTVRLGDLVELSTVPGPTSIYRLNRRRTVTLLLNPPPAASLESVLETIDSSVVRPLRAELGPTGAIRVAGSADSLGRTVASMTTVAAVALLILLLLMTALFQSLRDSLIVLLTIPVAVAGGVLALRLLGLFRFQTLDLLSMIGFVMMIAVVINHAILLVAAIRGGLGSGVTLETALRSGLNQRLRPIVASTLTGALGALPMALSPGPASVIYRGLAAVNVGGVVVSLIFSLVLIPALLRLIAGRAVRQSDCCVQVGA